MVPARHKKKLFVKNNIEKQKTQKKLGIKKTEAIYGENQSRRLLWSLAFVSVVFCFFAISFLFSRAEITVFPKTTEIELRQNLFASKEANNGNLDFRLMVVSDEEVKTIQATEEKDVEIRATGAVIIFNSFSSSPQTLSIDTRLEGSNRKIYKTQEKIIVPGMGADGTPGKAKVVIYAAEAGEEYNSGPLDFTILGFKDTPKYSKIIGRSETGTEITGGFKGRAPAVSEEEKAKATEALKKGLREKLLMKSADYPDNFILFKDAIFINMDDSNITTYYNEDKSMTMKIKGTLYGFLFNEQKLIEKIAKNNVEKYDGSDIYISNIKDLIFSLSPQTGSTNNDISFGDIQDINFNLSGTAKIVWKLDEDKFMADLLGRSKKDFDQILSEYKNIDSAHLKLRPMWRMSIPDKINDINITVNYPENYK